MYAAKGVGLAATQADVHQRVLVLDISEERNQPRVFINPELLSADGRGSGEEGCLSVPDIYEKVQRATRIRVRALGVDGLPFEIDAEGLLGICIQHEMDHLEGKLFVDYLSELKRQLIRRRLEKERKQRSSGTDSRTTPLGAPAPRRVLPSAASAVAPGVAAFTEGSPAPATQGEGLPRASGPAL
jgi:peptide deformylase